MNKIICILFIAFCLQLSDVSANEFDIKANVASLILVGKLENIYVYAPVISPKGKDIEWKKVDIETTTDQINQVIIADLAVTEVLYSAEINIPNKFKVSISGAYSLISKLRRDLAGKEKIYYLRKNNINSGLAEHLKSDESINSLPGNNWNFHPDNLEQKSAITAAIAKWHTGERGIPASYHNAHELWLSQGPIAAEKAICQISNTVGADDTFLYIKALQVLHVSGYLWAREDYRLFMFDKFVLDGTTHDNKSALESESSEAIFQCLLQVGKNGPPEIVYALATINGFGTRYELVIDAANRGYVSAQYLYAKTHRGNVFRSILEQTTGENDRQNGEIARIASSKLLLAYMEHAADSGDIRAQYEAACAYSTVDCGYDNSSVSFSQLRKIVAPKPEKAANWLLSAVTGRMPFPDYIFSQSYNDSQSVSERLIVYKRGRTIVLRNNIRFMLGQMYELGVGLPRNPEAAFKNFLEASEDGDSEAALHVARCYEHGIGVRKNVVEALRWKSISTDLGKNRDFPLY